jgi:hypothetical protein
MTRRIGVAVGVWVLCVPALAMSLGMALGGGMDALANLDNPSGKWLAPYETGRWGAAPLLVAAVAICLAWLSLLVMTVAWARERRVSRWWPVAGTVAAGLGLLAFSASIGPKVLLGALCAAPGILFAVFLCRFHLGTKS